MASNRQVIYIVYQRLSLVVKISIFLKTFFYFCF
nr:MAG TPA: hypothetical protein [Caudoviricetes sp.]